MRAAGYGKSFLSDYDSDEFVECCRKLRVLNNCRKSAGMPITSQQYDRLTPEVGWMDYRNMYGGSSTLMRGSYFIVFCAFWEFHSYCMSVLSGDEGGAWTLWF